MYTCNVSSDITKCSHMQCIIKFILHTGVVTPTKLFIRLYTVRLIIKKLFKLFKSLD